MTQLYVPDKAYLVCSDGMQTQQIKVSSQSTIKIANGRLAATIKDRTSANFVCAKMVIAGAVIGVIVAAIIAAAIVLSGGTLAIGLGAMLAAGAVGGAAVGLKTALTPCICAVLTMPKDWQPVHPKVLLEGKEALIERSVVPCFLGGSVNIMYSKEAAEAMASLNRTKALASVAAIATMAFIAGTAAAALGSAAVAVKATFVTYGITSGVVHLLGMGAAGGASYGVNALYDKGKDSLKIDGHSASEYISGDAYPQGDDVYNTLDDGVEIATDKRVGAVGDAIGSAEDIGKNQTYDLRTNTQTTQTIGANRVYVASSNGTITPPGTITATETTIASSNRIPLSSAARTGQLSTTQTGPILIRSTPGTIEASRTITTNTYSTQFSNRGILLGAGKAFLGNWGLGLAKGMGTNVFFDAVRAAGNWFMADDIKALKEALQNAEVAAKKSITVVEDEV